MDLSKVVFIYLALLALNTYAKDREPYLTTTEPLPNADEIVKVMKRPFPSCKTMESPYFCTAHGVIGQRLCYTKLELKNEFIVAENDNDQGVYIGNECFSKAVISTFLCRNSVESAHFNELFCINKKRN